MAPPGTVTWTAGFQVTVVLPSTLVALTTACGVPDRLTVVLWVKAAGPPRAAGPG
jgi:hypothetical protein